MFANDYSIIHSHFITIESIGPLLLIVEYFWLIFRRLKSLHCSSKHRHPQLLFDMTISQHHLYLLYNVHLYLRQIQPCQYIRRNIEIEHTVTNVENRIYKYSNSIGRFVNSPLQFRFSKFQGSSNNFPVMFMVYNSKKHGSCKL